jgi:hypothetical protein
MSQPDEPFVQLYRSALRDRSLSSEARWVGVLMSTYVGEGGFAWPSTTTLMKLSGWGENKVKAARSEVVRAGWFCKIRERGAHGRFERKSSGVKFVPSPKLLRRGENSS